MTEFGSLILLNFGGDNAGEEDPAETQAHLVAKVLARERLNPDVVWSPPRTKSLPLVSGVLGALRRLPRIVNTDRLLDVPAAWPSGAWSLHADADGALLPGDTHLVLMASVAMAGFYRNQIVPLLLDRQTVLVIASPESTGGLRQVLLGNDRQVHDGEEGPSGRPLVYTFDRKLRPVDRTGTLI